MPTREDTLTQAQQGTDITAEAKRRSQLQYNEYIHISFATYGVSHRRHHPLIA